MIPERDWNTISFAYGEFEAHLKRARSMLEYLRTNANPYADTVDLGCEVRFLEEITHRLGAIARDTEVHLDHLRVSYERSGRDRD